MTYKIAIKSTLKKKPYNTSLHLITGFGMMGVGAFSFLMGTTDWVQKMFHAPVISNNILSGISLLYGLAVLYFVFFKGSFLKNKKNNQSLRSAHCIVGSLLAIVFLLSQWWLAAAICALLAISALAAIYVDKKLEETLWVQLDEEKILLPATSRRKQLLWTEVERVILRHGNITIDCVDNFLFQWTLLQPQEDAAMIEAFCAARIHANKDKRQLDNW